MKKALMVIGLICLSAGISQAQQAGLLNDSTDAKTQITKEITDLNAELSRLNEIVQMLEEKNKLKAKIEALKKQIQTLQQPAAPEMEPRVETSNPVAPATSQVVQPAPAPVSTNSTPVVSKPVSSLNQKADEAEEATCLDIKLRPKSYSNFEKTFCDLAVKIVERKFLKLPGQPAQITISTDTSQLQAILLAKIDNGAEIKKFILEAEEKRTDKQLGADGKSAGSTSLLVKGGMPRFLSWAVESGAAEGTRNGTTLTFRVNPLGFLNSVTQSNYLNELVGRNELTLQPEMRSDVFTKILRNTSVGFSFDISRGTGTPTFIGSKQQLSAVSVRYQFLNERDPTNKKYRADWQEFAEKVGSVYLTKVSDAWDVIVNDDTQKFKNPVLQKWLENANAEIAKATIVPTSATDRRAIEEMLDILEKEVAKLNGNDLKNDAALPEATKILGLASIQYSKEKRDLLEKIQKGNIISAEYTNYREVNAPDLSNFRFIAQTSVLDKWSLDFNASLTFFNKKPSGANLKRLRDFDFALQMERKLTIGENYEVPFSFAGKYQRIAGSIADALGIVQPGTKGDIAFGQVKIVFPLYGTGIKLPFSLTFANRSELIKEKRFGANFGFTFDFDRIFMGGLPF
jgi:hypothetical protein